MGRLDSKRGRFGTDFETNQIHDAMRGWQAATVGDEVMWYRFNATNTVIHDIYDEGFGTGKSYDGPIKVPVLHATHLEGRDENGDTGMYFNDELHFTASFDQIRRTGIVELDLETKNYLKDRILYDDRVFRIMNIQVLGQVQERDIIAGVDATQVKPDELVNDVQFATWSEDAASHYGYGYVLGPS